MSVSDSPTASLASPPDVDVAAARRQEAMESMSACLLQLVEGREVLRCSSTGAAFHITDVLDGGGFASLLKGKLYHRGTAVTAAAPAAAARHRCGQRMHRRAALRPPPALRTPPASSPPPPQLHATPDTQPPLLCAEHCRMRPLRSPWTWRLTRQAR
jgi:hypothetical protein